MVEPVSVTCGILYAGLGSVLWSAAQTAAGGVLGNRTDAAAVAIGKALHDRLLARRGLSENHDIARALRKAQINATEFVVECYARRHDPNPPVEFLARARAALKAARKDAEALKWDPDVEAAMFASYQQAFRAPEDADDLAAVQARLAEQATGAAWAEIERWSAGAHIPDRLKQRFFGQMPPVIGFYDAWCGEVVEAMKTDDRFRAIFTADKLVEIGDLVVHGQAVLARLEDSTEGAREQLRDLKDWLSGQFSDQHDRHDETQEMLRQIHRMMDAQGRTLQPQEEEAVRTTLEDVAGSTGPDLAEAREALADEDPIALIDSLEAAASADAAAQLRRAGTIAYAVDVERARRIYAKVAALEPDDHWTHILLGRLAILMGDLSAARVAAGRALETSVDDRARSVAFDALGNVAVREGDLAGARKAYEDGLVIARDLCARDPQNTVWLRDLSISHNKLGDVAWAEGNLAGARKAYEDGLVIHRDLSERDPENTEWLRDLSVSYDRLGDVARAEGDLPRARKVCEDGLVIARDLSARDPKNTVWLRDLSISYYKIGDVAVAEGNLSGARQAYEDGLAITKDLSARDPANANWRRDVWTSLWRLAEFDDSAVNWSEVRDAIAAEKARGCLLKADKPFMAEAERRAAG